MKMVPFTNTSRALVTVGGKSVMPGETRMVNGMCMPPTPVAQFDPAMLLAMTVKDIAPILGELTPDQLALVLDAEQSSPKPRKGMVESISQAILDCELAFAIREFAESLSECADGQLEEKLLEFRDDPDRMAAIKAEQAKRA